MTNKIPDMVCYGEVLWDVFPDKKVIGGAPLNVALRLHSLGFKSGMISKIGRDVEGKKIMEHLKKVGMNPAGIQQDPNLKTGEVLISLGTGGSATYVITEPVAWDAIEVTQDTLDWAQQARLFIFGSLACRQPKSMNTLERLLDVAPFKVFDVNLRAPFYTEDLIIDLMFRADFVKMNDEELIEITDYMDGELDTLQERAEWLKQEMNLQGLCITLGSNGAILFYNNQEYTHNGYAVRVKDTVGAGDSFLATLLGELYIKKSDPEVALDRACAIGALVASKEGANCEVMEDEIVWLTPNP